MHGEDVPKYSGGDSQRRDEIDGAATQTSSDIIADLLASVAALEQVFGRCSAAGWPNGHFLGGGSYGAAGCPAHRLREVEMHHVDLGLDYLPSDWPQEYVAWDLPILLTTVDSRIAEPDQRRAVLAWLAGRAQMPVDLDLEAWG